MLIDGRINTISASCGGSRPSWALVGAGCSNQMQVAQGQGQVRDSIEYLWCDCPLCVNVSVSVSDVVIAV